MPLQDRDPVMPRDHCPTPTCCACIIHDGKLLLIQRATEPSKGQWSFPGGRIELGETIFEAVKREVGEEVGIEVEPQRVFQVYDWIVRDEDGGVRFHYLVNYVRCRYQGGDPRASSEASAWKWVTLDELEGLTMHPFVRQTARRLLSPLPDGVRLLS